MRLAAEKVVELEEYAYRIRRLSLEMITYACWGHPGGSFSMAEILAVLYFQAMRIDPDKPDWEERDRLVLSKAHGSPGLYAALALRGFYPREKVFSYCELGGFEGHTDMLRTPGLESSGGPLGMGLSVAAGMALGLRFKGFPASRVYCILGDGEINEGNIWEAAMCASHYHLDNLIAILDYNKVMAKGVVCTPRHAARGYCRSRTPGGGDEIQREACMNELELSPGQGRRVRTQPAPCASNQELGWKQTVGVHRARTTINDRLTAFVP
jgi:transketolase